MCTSCLGCGGCCCYLCFHGCHHCCGDDPAKYDHWENNPRAEAAVVMIQKHVRRWLVQRWVRRFYKNSKKMAAPWWRLTFSSLMFFKVMLNIVCVVTATDKLTQWDAAIPTDRNTENLTPLQQHPHLFGWVYQMLVISHNFTGLGLFIFGFSSLFSKKVCTSMPWCARRPLSASSHGKCVLLYDRERVCAGLSLARLGRAYIPCFLVVALGGRPSERHNCAASSWLQRVSVPRGWVHDVAVHPVCLHCQPCHRCVLRFIFPFSRARSLSVGCCCCFSCLASLLLAWRFRAQTCC